MGQLFSANLVITKSSKSVTDPIPVDLLIDIFSRVPAKSIARFRCVSKFWESIIGGQYFTELFLAKSVSRPRLFFALRANKEILFFSSPQPQNSDETSSLVATPYKAFPNCFPKERCTLLHGLVFLQNWEKNVGVICNPVTGESITLPKVEGRGDPEIRQSERYFGFDPISKQYKVLCNTVTWSATPNSHRVFTLDTGEPLWKPIQDSLLPRYISDSRNICINGVVYYPACSTIVCFDFRTGRFSLINMDRDMLLRMRDLSLFNYKGKLGVYHNTDWCSYGEDPLRTTVVVSLWVLEDAGIHKWSKRICKLPPVGNQILTHNVFVGMNGTGELVFAPKWDYLSIPYHIVYYNIDRNTFTKFKIPGFEEFKDQRIIIHTFLDYVENIKFM